MDCFDRGGFSGKGILDVRALLACCGGDALPEQRILSHDALEGAYLHGGFLGDVELTDTFPAAPLAWGARAHRWIRGDWQNAPWIFSRRARALHPIDRFRLADSLRWSLVAPATWLAIFLGCVLRWPGLRLAAYARTAGALAQGAHPLRSVIRSCTWRTRVRYHSNVLPGLAAAVVQTVLRLILLPWEAVVNASAIATALWRMLVWRMDGGAAGGGRAGRVSAVQLNECARAAQRRRARQARRVWAHICARSARQAHRCNAAAARGAAGAGLGSILRRFTAGGTCRRTMCRPSRRPARRTAHRRRTWALRSCPRSAHTRCWQAGSADADHTAPVPSCRAPCQRRRVVQRELLGWAKATWQYFLSAGTPAAGTSCRPASAHRTSPPTNMGFALRVPGAQLVDRTDAHDHARCGRCRRP